MSDCSWNVRFSCHLGTYECGTSSINTLAHIISHYTTSVLNLTHSSPSESLCTFSATEFCMPISASPMEDLSIHVTNDKHLVFAILYSSLCSYYSGCNQDSVRIRQAVIRNRRSVLYTRYSIQLRKELKLSVLYVGKP